MSDTPSRVIITGFDITFFQLVLFFFKAVLAALPALLVFAVSVPAINSLLYLLH
ncbi:hypothetical protein [Microvirga sp. G4-2]|uniref:hypothetical protein n=1 Tax=Microvirga sp. G4-2 TaxID=3434467 RepID=UPI004044DFEE